MARLTDDQRELVLADFHTGQYTQQSLGEKYNTSHVTIGKIVKGLEPKHKDKVTTISAMTAELHQESYKEVTAVTKAIDKRTQHILLFETSALRNQKVANKALDTLEKKEVLDTKDLYALDTHGKITQRNKETVLGKDKTTEINNTNAVQNNNNLKLSFE